MKHGDQNGMIWTWRNEPEQNPEINEWICGQLIYNEGAKNTKRRNNSLFNKLLRKLVSYM